MKHIKCICINKPATKQQHKIDAVRSQGMDMGYGVMAASLEPE